MQTLTSLGPTVKEGLSRSSVGGDTYQAKMGNGMTYAIQQEEWSTKTNYYLDTFVFHLPEIIAEFRRRGNPLKRVLEMGIARGTLSIGIALLTDADTQIVGIDIEEKTHTLVERNAQLNNIAGKIEVRVGDLFAPVEAEERFDLILGEMPFIPVDPEKQLQYIAAGHASEILNISGGADGRYFIDNMITQGAQYLSPGGSLILSLPSFMDVEKTSELFAAHGLTSNVLVSREWKLADTKFTRNSKEYIEATTGYRFPQNDAGEDIFYLTIMEGAKQ